MNPKNLIFLIIFTLPAFFAGCSDIKPERSPNIIYILADDLGYGDLGSYGQQLIKTPHLDRMAAEGMSFTQHYAGSTVCAPSRCTLMTGYHTGHATVRGNKMNVIKGADTTVAELLKNAGYATGLIGKWGLGGLGTEGAPTRQGFDFFYGFLDQIRAHNHFPEYVWRNEEKEMLGNKVVIADSSYAAGIGSAAIDRKDYVQDKFMEEALKFIEKFKDRPFYLQLSITIPHANNEHWLTGQHGMEVPDYGPYKDEAWPAPQKGTAAMITRMDRDIGGLFDAVKKLGIDENTLIIFSSDNGPHKEGLNDPGFFNSNGPFRGIKRDLYEGGIRVPMIARWPGKIAPGTVSDHLSAFWDFLPTACEVANTTTPENIDGISFLPVLTGQSGQKQHDYLYWEFYEQDGRQAIRTAAWKGVRYGLHEQANPPLQLYNLQQDPAEQSDLSGQNPEVVSELLNKMKAAHSPWPHGNFN